MFINLAEDTPDGNIGRPPGGGDQINDNLRRVYDDVLNDGIPDRFEELLRKLREQEGKQ